MYSSVFLGSMGVFLFSGNVFFASKPKWTSLYILTGIIFILIIALTDSSENILFPDSVISDPHYAFILRTEYSILLIIYLLPTFFVVSFIAFRHSKRMNEDLYKRGFNLIGYGFLSVLGVFICDTIAGFFLDNSVIYALFLYSQWVFALISGICLYLGYILPDWLRTRFQKKK